MVQNSALWDKVKDLEQLVMDQRVEISQLKSDALESKFNEPSRTTIINNRLEVPKPLARRKSIVPVLSRDLVEASIAARQFEKHARKRSDGTANVKRQMKAEITSLPCLNALSKQRDAIHTLYELWTGTLPGQDRNRSLREIASKKLPGVKKYFNKSVEERFKKIKSICVLIELLQRQGIPDVVRRLQTLMTERSWSLDWIAKKIPKSLKAFGLSMDSSMAAILGGSSTVRLSMPSQPHVEDVFWKDLMM